ncbi:MAG: MtrB/PioB family outer membrane beta-barrel protein, partial [Gammaproteobacteria bacterium]|nr:MtrB/PioB family outer membrane beta-barrel protein [Gammaproteobacteria bacterium]
RVIVDSIASGTSEINVPYSFERARFTASGSYQLFDDLRLSAGFDRKETDRDFQEVAEQTEDSSWGRARWRPADWLDISLKGGTSRRDIDRYDESVAVSLGQNPLLRKYNLAYRYRESAEITIAATPADWPLSTTIWAMCADDSYSQSQLGITESRNSHVSIDLNWAINDDLSLYFTAGGESISADQLGSDSFSVADWTAFHRDSFEHFGGGLTLRNIGDRTALSIDYYRTRGDTDIRIARTGMSASDFPEIDADLESLRLSLRYQRSERMDIDLSFRYESFVTSDWAIAGVDPGTIPVVLTLGADPYDYGVWVFGASFHYLVGGR